MMEVDPVKVAQVMRLRNSLASSPAEQARLAREEEARRCWDGIRAGMACRLTPEALERVRAPRYDREGREIFQPLPPPADTACRIWKVNPDQETALVVVTLPAGEWAVATASTITLTVGREEVLIAPFLQSPAPPPAGDTPPPGSP